jgi:hypothetical protein
VRSTSTPTTPTKAVVAISSLGLIVGAGGLALQQAHANPVSSKIAASCALGTGKIDVTVPLSVDDKVDPVAAGGSETVETRTGLPALPVEATINKLVVTTPIPTQIASVDAVTFSGGNMKSSASVVGRNLVVTFTGPVSSKDIQVPTVTARQTVKSGIGGTPISWKTFSKVDADTSYGMATCTPNNPSQVVNTTTVTGSSTATTTAPTGPAPTTTPAPSNAPGRGDSTVSVSGSATIGVSPPTPTAPPLPTLPTPAVPATPTLPVPVPGGGGVPGSPSLPVPVPSAPTLPVPVAPVPKPTVPPKVCPMVPLPLPLGLPALPCVPPVPTPAPPSVPSVPTVPKLPTGVGVSVGVTANLRGLS